MNLVHGWPLLSGDDEKQFPVERTTAFQTPRILAKVSARRGLKNAPLKEATNKEQQNGGRYKVKADPTK